ncbi:MAG TPA: threonine synthase [Bacteroidales bacterium]|nr:threonine synthase [Bacteroidales bacterium]HRW96729.1 threonine synthase [Bacteroidales bacterium]
MNQKFRYQCVTCGKEFETDEIIYLCPDCERKNKPGEPLRGVLKVIYDYDMISDDVSGDSLFSVIKDDSYLDLLPIEQSDTIPGLRIGHTPMYEVDTFEGKPLSAALYIKNDARNPTLSFKDRASVIVSAFAQQKGIDTIVTASTGNAGSSMAGICAAQGQKAIVIVPENAPFEKLIQIVMYGATLIPVKGTYDDAFDLSVELTKKTGIYNRNTAYNPFTIEGKKIAAFEIYDDLLGEIPDNIFIPVGDGVIISAIYKGFEELMKLHLTKSMPTIVAVQAEGSPNLVDNLNRKVFKSVKSKTIADSISVDVPRNFHMTANYMKSYHGKAIKVSDDEIIQASLQLGRNTGIFAEPSAAAALAGFFKMYRMNEIDEKSVNLVMITGSGMKDMAAIKSYLTLPKPIPNDLDKLLRHLDL